MHIGILSPDLSNHHGAAHYSYNLLLALQRAGAQLTILAPHTSPRPPELVADYRLPQITPRARLLVPRLFAARGSIGRRLRHCDLIHASAEHYSLLGMWIAGGRPLFTNVHGTYATIDRLHGWPSNALYRRAMRRSTLLCLSSYTAQVARAHLKLAPEQTPVVHPGIDAARFAHLPNNVQKQGPTVLAAGGVKTRKGTLALVRALAVVREQIRDVQCVVLGSLTDEPVYVQQVRQLIAELQLENVVHLPGFVDADVLLGWYAVADVFALPSVNEGVHFEGFGLVHLEASAAGLPVIGSRGCGVEDAIDDGVTGLLIDQSDMAVSLPRAILTILTQPDRARQMGEAGRQRAQATTWDATAGRVIGLYEAALNAGR